MSTIQQRLNAIQAKLPEQADAESGIPAKYRASFDKLLKSLSIKHLKQIAYYEPYDAELVQLIDDYGLSDYFNIKTNEGVTK